MFTQAGRRKTDMAQIANHYMPTYREDELRFKLINRSFADKPHPVFVAYDEATDQFLVWMVEPSKRLQASEYYIADDIAFLVRDDNREVVGFVVNHFQETFLPRV